MPQPKRSRSVHACQVSSADGTLRLTETSIHRRSFRDVDTKTVGNRLRAARTLAGLTRPQLARELNLPGLGEKTLGAIERGSRDLRPQEVQPLATLLDVPTDFLTGPTERDPAGEEVDLSAVAEKLDHVLANQAKMLDRLDTLEQHLDAKTAELLPGIRELIQPAALQAPVPEPERS